VIFGQSCGWALGALYASRLPDKVAAYVGSGQYGDAAAGQTASYPVALPEPQRPRNRKALRKLRELGPPPDTPEQLMAERSWVTRLEGGMRHSAWATSRASRPAYRNRPC
jgi:pimeloyl-ACP methyl ester carboxylesterase